MSKIMIVFMMVALLTFPANGNSGNAFNEVVECIGRTTKVKAVTVKGVQQRSTIFNGQTNPPWQLHPTPIIRTTVDVTEQGCLIVHFSAMAQPMDNWIVFQVLITGNGYVDEPLEGHTIGLGGGSPIPTIFSVDETLHKELRIVSRTFHKSVQPGTYQVKVLMAGGNNVTPQYEPHVYDPTLVINYN